MLELKARWLLKNQLILWWYVKALKVHMLAQVEPLPLVPAT